MTSGNDEGWFDGFAFDVMTPVRLHEHCINLRQIDGFSLVADDRKWGQTLYKEKAPFGRNSLVQSLALKSTRLKSSGVKPLPSRSVLSTVRAVRSR